MDELNMGFASRRGEEADDNREKWVVDRSSDVGETSTVHVKMQLWPVTNHLIAQPLLRSIIDAVRTWCHSRTGGTEPRLDSNIPCSHVDCDHNHLFKEPPSTVLVLSIGCGGPAAATLLLRSDSAGFFDVRSLHGQACHVCTSWQSNPAWRRYLVNAHSQ